MVYHDLKLNSAEIGVLLPLKEMQTTKPTKKDVFGNMFWLFKWAFLAFKNENKNGQQEKERERQEEKQKR